MSLRARLTLFFVIIVVLPVTAVTAYGWQAVARSTQRQVRSELELARRSATVALTAQAERAHEAVAGLARDPALLEAMSAGDAPRVRAVLRRQGATDLLLAVTAPDHRALGRAGHTNPGFLPGVRRAPLGMLLAPKQRVRSSPMSSAGADLRPRGCAPAGSRRCLLGTVTAGIWMDSQELQRLARGTLDADLTLVVGDTPVASTIGRLTAEDRVPAADGTRRGKLAGRQVVMATEPLTSKVGEQARLLVSIPRPPRRPGSTRACWPSCCSGWWSSALSPPCSARSWPGWSAAPSASWPARPGRSPGRTSPAPRRASAPAARSVTSPPPRSSAVSWLAAFERMRVELGEYLSALRSSRDELARSMNRLGETLSSSDDLPKLLAVVLEAAVQARRAKAGSLLLLTPDRTALVREATHGLTQRDPAERIPVSQGVAGTVAANGRAMVLASPAGNGAGEPAVTTQVSVPLLAQGRVLGVLSLYDREDGEPFTLADAEALTAFAVAGRGGHRERPAARRGRAAVGHRPAHRRACNRRHLFARRWRWSSRARAASAPRCGNCSCWTSTTSSRSTTRRSPEGRQRACRVRSCSAGRLRSDTFARYGGEEIVVIMPR